MAAAPPATYWRAAATGSSAAMAPWEGLERLTSAMTLSGSPAARRSAAENASLPRAARRSRVAGPMVASSCWTDRSSQAWAAIPAAARAPARPLRPSTRGTAPRRSASRGARPARTSPGSPAPGTPPRTAPSRAAPDTSPRTAPSCGEPPPASVDMEPAQTDGLGPGLLDVLHLGVGRPGPEADEEKFDVVAPPLGHDLDAPVVEVLDVPRQVEDLGLGAGEGPEAHSLHLPLHDGREPRPAMGATALLSPVPQHGPTS